MRRNSLIGAGLLADLRYAWRTLGRSRGFAAIAVLLLGLGMGAATAIFSLMNSVLYKSLAVKEPGQLVLLTDPESHGMSIGTQEGPRAMLTYAEFATLRERVTSFSHMFAVDSSGRALNGTIESGAPEEVRVRLVSGDYFPTLGVAPLAGRTFTQADEHGAGTAPYAVISYRFWQRRFGLSASALGRTISIQGTGYRVLGVMPPRFLGETVGTEIDLWVPMVMAPQIYRGRNLLEDDRGHVERATWLQVFGRLREGVSLRQAQAEADVVFRQVIEASFAQFSARQPELLRQSLKLRPGAEGTSSIRTMFGKPLFLLLGMAGVLLLTACANVAGLMLARATVRQKEVAMRQALGASRARLVRQFLAEGLLIAGAAAAVGGILGGYLTEVLVRMTTQPGDRIALDLQPDWRVFGFVAAVGLLCAAIAGMTPAWFAARSGLNEILKGAAAGVRGGFGRARAGKAVVVSQIALATLLLMAGGWFAFTLRNLGRIDLGYPREHLLEVRVDPLTAGYRGPRLAAVYQALQQRFAAVPGVRAVAYSDNGLFTGRESEDEIAVEGFPSKTGSRPHARWDQVGPGYFSILGVPMLKGREIGPADVEGARRVCVINRAFAERFFPHADPIGKHVTDEYPDTRYTFEIVGVSGNAHDKKLRDKVPPRFYIPALQPMTEGDYTDAMNYMIRTYADPGSLEETMRRQVAAENPEIRVVLAQPVDELIANQTLSDTLLARLALAAGLLALLITCFGLYAVLSYSVARRISELGVRIALGAQRGQITRAVLGEALGVAAGGLAVGIPAALAASRLVQSQFFGLSAADPATLAAVALTLVVTTMAAAAVPAYRAAAIDPIRALRCE